MSTTQTHPTRRVNRARALLDRLAGPAFVALIGIGLASLLIQLQGYNAGSAILAGLKYALGSPEAVVRTLAWALPLLVVSIGVCVAFRSGMFNIGAEGQVFAGAMGAAIAGAYIGPMLGIVHLALCLLFGGMAGALIAGLFGWLRAAWGVDEVLSTLLSNYIVILFCTYLANGPLRDPTRQSGTTPAVHDSARFGELISGTGMSSALFVVIGLGVLTWWVADRSILGYRWRMTGESPPFAAAMGMRIQTAQVQSMICSGALCGVGGALLVSASQGRFWTQIGSGVGWDAVLIALVAGARPLAAMAWTILYAVMRSAARGIEQATEVPSELALILVAVIIVAAVARPGVFRQVQKLGKTLVRTRGARRGMA